jgi:hypothetical protein
MRTLDHLAWFHTWMRLFVVGIWLIGALTLLANMWRCHHIFIITLFLGNGVVCSSWSLLGYNMTWYGDLWSFLEMRVVLPLVVLSNPWYFIFYYVLEGFPLLTTCVRRLAHFPREHLHRVKLIIMEDIIILVVDSSLLGHNHFHNIGTSLIIV